MVEITWEDFGERGNERIGMVFGEYRHSYELRPGTTEATLWKGSFGLRLGVSNLTCLLNIAIASVQRPENNA